MTIMAKQKVFPLLSGLDTKVFASIKVWVFNTFHSISGSCFINWIEAKILFCCVISNELFERRNLFVASTILHIRLELKSASRVQKKDFSKKPANTKNGDCFCFSKKET
jgi:hypothetical protein